MAEKIRCAGRGRQANRDPRAEPRLECPFAVGLICCGRIGSAALPLDDEQARHRARTGGVPGRLRESRGAGEALFRRAARCAESRHHRDFRRALRSGSGRGAERGVLRPRPRSSTARGARPRRRASARNILFDLAHAIGKSDAHNFHTQMGLSDPVARLSAGPIHFAYSGWAFVDIDPASSPRARTATTCSSTTTPIPSSRTPGPRRGDRPSSPSAS